MHMAVGRSPDSADGEQSKAKEEDSKTRHYADIYWICKLEKVSEEFVPSCREA
jgi:hypothetical protein